MCDKNHTDNATDLKLFQGTGSITTAMSSKSDDGDKSDSAVSRFTLDGVVVEMVIEVEDNEQNSPSKSLKTDLVKNFKTVKLPKENSDCNSSHDESEDKKSKFDETESACEPEKNAVSDETEHLDELEDAQEIKMDEDMEVDEKEAVKDLQSMSETHSVEEETKSESDRKKTKIKSEATTYRPVAEWVRSAGGSVPPNAIEVGYDGGDVIYVGRAHHQGDNIPGKLVPKHGVCYVAWGGEEHPYPQYEVLTAPYGVSLEWRFANGADIPPGAVQGGSTADGEPLYIGRVNHDGAMCSGKVHPSHGVLYVSYAGGEHPHNTYEVLVVKSVNF